MFKQIFKAKLALAAAILLATPALAEEATTLKVENGVTVKSGTPSLPTPPASTSEKPVERVFMKPIIDEKALKKKAEVSPEEKSEEPKTTKFVEKKEDPKKEEVKKDPSPFKKSQDANAVETVKKPAPTPEVKAKPLEKDNIAGELKNLDALKNKKDPEIKENVVETGVGESGLPIPRFVSLKSGEANARTGPGETYPIRWVYQRKHLPVEITAEFKLWRRIKDVDGEQSWVHQALLSSNRYAILNRDAVATSNEDGSGSSTARFKKGVQVKVVECQQAFCEVEYGRIDGWVKKTDLWGIYPDEIFD